MKCFFIVEFERAAKIRKNAIYRFLISLLVPVVSDQKVPEKAVEISQNQ